MENKSILLGALVTTIVVMGGIIAFLSYDSPSATNNTTTQNNTTQTNTNNTQPTTIQTNEDKTNNQKYISESQALSIAEAAMPGSESYYISGYPTSDSPYYYVTSYDSGWSGPPAVVKINAITGKVVLATT